MLYADFGSSTLVLLGDSIIDQMRPLQWKMPPPFSRATNLGVSGEVVAQIADQVRSIPSSATHVMIEGGVNDLIRGGSDSDVIAGYAAIFRSISRDKRIIVMGILPVEERLIGPDLLKLVNNFRIAGINAQLASSCSSIPNCTPALSLMSMDMSGETRDGIHLTAKAYREWPAMLEQALK
jgi:lysophospholipase L1-like esterase